MTVGHCTIEISGSSDNDYLNAYNSACHALLDRLKERVPPWKKSPADSSVTLEKGNAYYAFRVSTPMESKEIKTIVRETEEFEHFHILKRTMNYSLTP